MPKSVILFLSGSNEKNHKTRYKEAFEMYLKVMFQVLLLKASGSIISGL
jgi:hypothetical protein